MFLCFRSLQKMCFRCWNFTILGQMNFFFFWVSRIHSDLLSFVALSEIGLFFGEILGKINELIFKKAYLG